MDTLKVKFEITSITTYAGIPGIKVVLCPAMDRESLKFISTGKIEMMIDDSNSVSFFEVGKEYDVSFNRAAIM
jgi:hypothetical protein